MEEKARKVADLLRLLANEQRLLILCALIQEPMAVGSIHRFTPHITAPKGITMVSNISHVFMTRPLSCYECFIFEYFCASSAAL